MANTFHLEVLTPGRVFFEGDVEEVIIPGVEGYEGILVDHVPIIISLNDGALKIKADNEWKEAVIHAGFAQVEQKRTIIMSDAVEWPEEIDVNRAQAAKERAEERLRQQLSQMEYHRSKAALARAMARLRVTKIIE